MVYQGGVMGKINAPRARVDDPKRFSSRRKIDLGSKTVVALKAHHKRQIEEQLKSPSWEEKGFVFTTHQGGYLHPQTL